MAARSSTPRTRACLAAMALSAFLIAILRAPTLSGPIRDRDEGAYVTVAWLWNEGYLPYRDVFDHKPPLIHLVYRLGIAPSPNSFAGVQTVYALLILATAAACGLLVTRMTGGVAGPTFAAAAASILLSASHLDALRAHPEVLAAAGYCWAIALLIGREKPSLSRTFCAGLLASCALLAKPIILGEVVLLALYLLLTCREHRAKHIGCYIVGIVVPVLAIFLYFTFRGALGAMWNCLWDYNRAYQSASPIPPLIRLQRVWRFTSVQVVPLLAIAIAGLVWGKNLVRRRDERYLGAWLFVAYLAAVFQGRIYRHHLLLLVPPIAILAGVALEQSWQRASAGRFSQWKKTVTLTLFCSALLPAAVLTIRDAHQNYGSSVRSNDVWVRAGEVLRNAVPEEETILVWGAEPQVYWYAKRKPATRFIYKYPLFVPGNLSEKYRREFFASLVQNPPAAVMVVRLDPSLESPSTSEHEFDLLREHFHPIIAGMRTLARTPHYYILAQPDLVTRFRKTNTLTHQTTPNTTSPRPPSPIRSH